MASHSNFEFKMGVVKFSPSCSILYLFAIFDSALYFCLLACLFIIKFCFEVVYQSDSNVHIMFSLSQRIFFCALSTIEHYIVHLNQGVL